MNPRPTDVLEANIERLLQRAYHPVEVREEFRAGLERRFLSTAADRWPVKVAARPAPVRNWSFLAAAAALALILGAGALLVFGGDGAGARSETELASSGSGSATSVAGQSAPGTDTEARESAPGRPGDLLSRLFDSTGDRRRLPSIPGMADGAATVASDSTDSTAVDPSRLALELIAPEDAPGSALAAPSGVEVLLLRAALLPDVVDPVRLVGDDLPGDPASRRRSFSELEPGRHTLHVFVDGFAPWRREVDLRPGELLEVDVELELGGSARGVVVDAATGEPLVDALILSEDDLPLQVISPDLAGNGDVPAVVARTDSAGAFRLTPLSRGAHRLRATAPGHAPAWIDVEIGDEQVAPLRFELDRGGVVFGRTADEFGRPRTDAIVVASFFESPGGARKGFYGVAATDAQGLYRIEGLPAGVHVVLLFETEEPEAPSAMLPLVLGEAAERRVDFVPDGSGSALTGVVVDALGAPVPGLVITLSLCYPLEPGATVSDDEGIGSWTAVTADDEGRFRFEDVAPGNYALFGAHKAGSEMVLLHEVDMRAGLDETVRVVRSSRTLRGRATSAADGLPAPETILLLLRDDEFGRTVFAGRQLADAEGRYAFEGAQPGEYRMLALPSRHDLAAALRTELVLEPSGDSPRVDFALEPGGVLEVVCVDVDGRPVVRADVDLIDAQGREILDDGRFKSRADGVAVIESVATGRWTVRVQAPGHARVERSVLAVAGETRRLEITLVPEE